MDEQAPEQSKPLHFDTALFAIRAKTKRGSKGLREAAREIDGVSASTLSRIESEHTVDLRTVGKVCQWLGMSPDDFFSMEATRQPEPLTAYQRIEFILRSETQLEESEINSIITLIIALDCCE